jgi:hypothetical protein
MPNAAETTKRSYVVSPLPQHHHPKKAPKTPSSTQDTASGFHIILVSNFSSISSEEPLPLEKVLPNPPVIEDSARRPYLEPHLRLPKSVQPYFDFYG